MNSELAHCPDDTKFFRLLKTMGSYDVFQKDLTRQHDGR